ncbi:MAG: hypothetical protein ACO1N7_03890 [Sphingobacteriaceae bacterium]
MKLSYISICKVFILISCISCIDRPETDDVQSGKNQGTDSQTTTDDLQKAQDNKPLSTVQDIKQAYAAVSKKLKDGALDSVSFKYSCNNEESGTVSYFSEKGLLRLIVHRYNEYSHFSAVDQYFVKDSTLFFVYKKSILWSFNGPQGSTKDSITEQRVYLIDQQPIRCLQKTFIIHSHATDNSEAETVMNKEVNCTSQKSVIKPYRLLARYHNNATTGCLEE